MTKQENNSLPVTWIASLAATVGEKVSQEFMLWLTQLSRTDQFDYLFVVAHFAKLISPAQDDNGLFLKAQEEAVAYYALALWRAYQLNHLQNPNPILVAA